LRRGWKLLAFLAAIVVLVVAGALAFPGGHGTVIEIVGSGGARGVSLYLVMYIIGGSLGIPPVIFVVASGILWPIPVALGISLSGGLTAAILGFVLSRHVARDSCSRYIPQRLHKYDEGIEKHGFKTTVILRLAFFLFPPVNWLLGISRLRISDYVVGTVIGCFPGMVAYTLIGNDLVPWILQDPIPRLGITFGVILTLVSVVFGIPRILKRLRGPNDQGETISLQLFLIFVRDLLVASLQVFFPPKPHRRPPSIKRILVMLLFLPAFTVVQLIHWAALFLDEILFPRYRSIPVEKPLFIVGIPRSGTTHLHRVVARDTTQFTTTQLWHLVLAPAICERKVISALAGIDRAVGRPFERLLKWVNQRVTGGLEEIHTLALEEPEEDFLGLIPALACFILTAAFPESQKISDLARFDTVLSDERRRDVMAFYRGILQRHMYCDGSNKKLLSKNVSFTPMLMSLMETFPDAGVVVCLRDPVHTVPSQISSMEQGWEAFGNSTESTLYRDSWVDLIEHYCEHIGNVLDSPIGDRIECVEMGMLKSDLGETVHRLYDRFGLDMSPSFAERLEREVSAATKYSSRHKYSLEDYGLNADKLNARFRAVWKRLRQHVYAETVT